MNWERYAVACPLVVQGPEGALYLLTDGDSGKLLKITPDK